MNINRLLSALTPSIMLHKFRHLLFLRFAGARFFTLAILILILSSCSKDKQFDADLLSANNSGNLVSYVLKGRALQFNGQFYSSTKNFIRVPLVLKEEAKNTDTVFAVANPALVADYNQKYSENNQALPAKAFTASNNGIFPVKANASLATDSLYVLLTDASLLKNKTVYLVPVEVRTKSGAGMKYSVIYFKMLVTVGNLTANFLSAGVQLYKYSYYKYNSLQVDYDRIQKGTIPTVIKFSVGLNTPFTYHDVDISAEYGGDSISVAYGKKLASVSPQPFPADTYTIGTNAVTVTAGSMSPKADSITVTLKNKDKFKSLTTYMLGVKIKQVVGSQYSVPPATNDSCMAYIRIYTY